MFVIFIINLLVVIELYSHKEGIIKDDDEKNEDFNDALRKFLKE